MKTIKIIDLLNKIANGEEVPEKIKWRDKIWIYTKAQQDYLNHGVYFFEGFCQIKTKDFITDTVEIIEEQQDIDIEELDITAYLDLEKRPKWQKEHMIKTACLHTQWKINELIREIKQIDKQIKEKE